VVACSAFGNRLFLVIAGGLAMVQPVMAAPFTSAKVLRMVEGTEVFIDSNKARVNQTAVEGSVLSTRRSRAELLFNTRAIGLLGRSSAIKIGVRCFQLDSGVVVVNGTQRACLGSRILGVRGTTYVLAKDNEGYSVSVLAGEGIVVADLPEENAELNILNRYPRSNPSLNIQLGGYGAVYPSGGGAFTGGLSYFQPLIQSSAKNILYSSTSIGSSFQNLWGVSTEVGYRWFSPAQQSTNSAYVGYSGYGSPGCYSNLINGGLQWEKSRWRLGGSGGVKVNNCPSGLSYGALNLSIPVGSVKEQPVYLSISPYVLIGNVVGTDLLSSTSSSSFPGIRGTVEVPVNQHLGLRGYVGADSVFGVTLGGYFSYRIPTAGGRLYHDPNMPRSTVAKVSATSAIKGNTSAITPEGVTVEPQRFTSSRSPREVARLALAGDGHSVADVQQAFGISSDSQAQALADGVIREGQRGRFSADGELLSIEPISNSEFLLLLKNNFKGQNPLPESRRIARQAQARGVFNTNLAGFLGIDFLNLASLPVSNTVDTPFTPLTQIPVGRYVCSATDQARVIGQQEAVEGQFDYSGGAVYLGKGTKTSQGYPATYNKSDAYVFSDPGVCTELNRLANQGYNVVQAEKI